MLICCITPRKAVHQEPVRVENLRCSLLLFCSSITASFAACFHRFEDRQIRGRRQRADGALLGMAQAPCQRTGRERTARYDPLRGQVRGTHRFAGTSEKRHPRGQLLERRVAEEATGTQAPSSGSIGPKTTGGAGGLAVLLNVEGSTSDRRLLRPLGSALSRTRPSAKAASPGRVPNPLRNNSGGCSQTRSRVWQKDSQKGKEAENLRL